MKKRKKVSVQQPTMMNIMEAINTLCRWLLNQEIMFTLAYAQELTPTHYRIAIQQHAPAIQHRLFEVVPTDVACCWNVVEVYGNAPEGLSE